uniref:Cyanobacterial aminoacyl-tRNA synthetase CAAD domain-containing protein n=1 Tax=Kalanchoe fedtschenkoi TaxID=63787 RepID=A0A7N0U688_KALFE
MATPCAAATTSSAVAGGASAAFAPRLSTSPFALRSCSTVLPRLPPRALPSPSLKLASDASRLSSFHVRASSSEETPGAPEVGELFEDLKEKWDAIEDKTTVLLYGGGAVAAVWVSSIVVGAINSVPLLPKIMELVGLGYTGWFVYRYLLFKSGRKQLAEEIEALKKQITGT